jgi:Lrp/AsnC family transcriptional regulator, leucine-responsive regulatory protein
VKSRKSRGVKVSPLPRGPGAEIDRIDLRILAILQGDAKTSNVEIARRVGMVPSGIFERIRKLEKRNLVLGYQARLNPQLLNQELVAFVLVRADERYGSLSTGAHLAKIPEIQEVHHISGEDCYLIKVRAADPRDLSRILGERLGAIKSVQSTKTTIVLETLKEESSIPLGSQLEE